MKIIRVLVLITCLAGCCYAKARSPQKANGLTIGPADVLQIHVLDAPGLKQTVRVADDGEIRLILGGYVKVEGLTPGQAAAEIESVLKRDSYVLSPHVSVEVIQYATENVTILGQVKMPGAYPIGTPRNVMDVLALAGGVTNLANRHIVIKRHDTNKKIDFFLSHNAGTSFAEDVKVYPGDTVVVPKAEVVYVLGDVHRPGGIAMVTNDAKLSVMQAVALAGGTQPTAASAHVRLLRKNSDGTYVEINLPLNKMERGKLSDVSMEPNDILFVPFSFVRNMGLNVDALLAAAAAASVYKF